MRKTYLICLSLLLFSCFNNDKETGKIDQLNQRITRLEQRIDSLISGKNANSIGLNNFTSPNTNSYSVPRQSNHCQAITKKGKQCSRKAKNNSYCWQHGG
jgi:Family of unknown function (DUF5763)